MCSLPGTLCFFVFFFERFIYLSEVRLRDTLSFALGLALTPALTTAAIWGMTSGWETPLFLFATLLNKLNKSLKIFKRSPKYLFLHLDYSLGIGMQFLEALVICIPGKRSSRPQGPSAFQGSCVLFHQVAQGGARAQGGDRSCLQAGDSARMDISLLPLGLVQSPDRMLCSLSTSQFVCYIKSNLCNNLTCPQ